MRADFAGAAWLLVIIRSELPAQLGLAENDPFENFGDSIQSATRYNFGFDLRNRLGIEETP